MGPLLGWLAGGWVAWAITAVLFVPFLIVAFTVGPYVLWKRENTHKKERDRQIQSLVELRLDVSLERTPVANHPRAHGAGPPNMFWRVQVQNLSYAPIPRCYAVLEQCLIIGEDGRRIDNSDDASWPRPSQPLPWAREFGGKYEYDLPGKEIAYVDYARIVGGSALINIPSRRGIDERPDWDRYQLGWHNIEITVGVGSFTEPFPKSRIRFGFEHLANQEVTLTQLDFEEQVADTVDSST